MRVIIAGSRTLHGELGHRLVALAVRASGFDISEVISGAHHQGIDDAGIKWSYKVGLPSRLYPADWKKFGKAAGPLRNEVMAKNADALIAILDTKAECRGTRSMIRLAEKHGLKIFIMEHPNVN